mmetsp:Transcript_19567/g.33822  ORF Transcript_19567/g.33822 Transcript_19567/m.33822 type:complete len:82 (+) Transcript_19567:824-1069(+)
MPAWRSQLFGQTARSVKRPGRRTGFGYFVLTGIASRVAQGITAADENAANLQRKRPGCTAANARQPRWPKLRQRCGRVISN